MRVCIVPTYRGVDQGDGGIRRVVEAQQRYLPDLGIHVTEAPGDADLIACHGASLVEHAGVPLIAHSHGMMWREYDFGAWGDDVNRHVIDLMTRAQAVTAPSKWVAGAISRGMLVRPGVIYHGVDAAEWEHNHDHLGYVLWNKARADQVSDPDDMNHLASLLPRIPFVSTFGERGGNVMLCGPRSYNDMRPIVQKAGVYLATARETFGIGTLEALAAGVPVAGWRYGGQEEIIIDGETGYLAEWGDYEGLAIAVQRCLADRARLARGAMDDARARWGWADKIAQYAALYRDVLARWKAPRPRVSVVLTTHNLARYVGDALGSVIDQTMDDWECIIVDDASTDNTEDVVNERLRINRFFDSTLQVRYLKTPTNLKLSGARNYGWQHATGKYIIFLDADDMLAPNALDVLANALDQDTSIHIAYGHLDTVNDRGEERRRNPWPPDKFDWKGQLAHLNQLPYAAMLRREVLERSGGYRTRDWRAEDAALWCRLTSFGFRAKKVTEESTLIYRMRGDSKSRGEPGDGDWTAWYPWRLAASGPEGVQAMEAKKQPNPAQVPFGAQGTPPLPLRAWPVPHHQHPAVSVIIPVGPRHATYLIDALDSVQAQTCPAWECIVVADCDDIYNLNEHPWAQLVLTNGIGKGAGRARNVGLAAARAPLVVFLDADDMLTPRALEQMLRAYVGNQGGYIYSDWASLDDEARWDGEATWHHTPEYSEDLWFQGFQHPVTCLVETEHARAVGFDEKLVAWEDWKFYLDLLVRGVCPAKVAEPLLIYRLTSGTRRNAAKSNEERLLKTIRDTYAPYITGLEQLMACCGGNSAALNAARTALDDMLGPLVEELAFAAPPTTPGVVRMEFIGDSYGAQTWFSKDRQRQYEGGRDPRARFIDAAPEDAEYLVSLGVWRVVELPREEPELVLVEAAPQPRSRGRRRG